MSAAPGRHPCSLLKGALRLQILNIYRASFGLLWICDHERRRNEIRKGPARSRNSKASRRVRKSYGARWICESPFNQETSCTFRYNAPRCKLCPVIENEEILITPSNKIYKPTGTFSCNSKNMVYLIRCRKCTDALYIGGNQGRRNQFWMGGGGKNFARFSGITLSFQKDTY